MQIQYNRNFDLDAAYELLRKNNLDSVAQEISISKDHFGSYQTTLKRAKIVKVLSDNALLNKFVDSHWPSGKTPKGQTRIAFWLDLYDRFKNSANEDINDETQETEDIEGLEEKQFAAERDLHNYLANNLTKIEAGLKLYVGPDGTPGNEFTIDDRGRRIDILAIDKSGTPVIVELKVSKGHERTIGQVLYYEAMVKKLLNTDKTRIVIIASQISQELKLASETVKNIELFEYKISMEINRVT
jgi:hypothetical protein